jgi:hypothetical protein
MNDDVPSESVLDRRRWLKVMSGVAIGAVFGNRMFGTVARHDDTRARASALANAASPEKRVATDRRYIHGFETYSGF